jgi:hypothetical protein
MNFILPVPVKPRKNRGLVGQEIIAKSALFAA